MNNKKFLYIIIATLVTILIWAVFDIIHSRSNVQIPPETQQLLEPVNPNFDTNILHEF